MNIHDNEIINYQVNLKDKTILLHTISETNEAATILFNDLLAYNFENQLPGSILLDIFDAGIESFIPQNRDILKSRKDHLWPINYESEEGLYSYLQHNQYHYYVIQSSYGMNGWVVSKGMKVC